MCCLLPDVLHCLKMDLRTAEEINLFCLFDLVAPQCLTHLMLVGWVTSGKQWGQDDSTFNEVAQKQERYHTLKTFYRSRGKMKY